MSKNNLNVFEIIITNNLYMHDDIRLANVTTKPRLNWKCKYCKFNDERCELKGYQCDEPIFLVCGRENILLHNYLNFVASTFLFSNSYINASHLLLARKNKETQIDWRLSKWLSTR